MWGAPRSSSLWSPTPVPLLRFCLSRPGEPRVAGAPNSGLPGSTLGGGPRTVSGKCHDPLPRTRAPSPDPLLRGVRKRSGLGHGPCAVTVPFLGQASNTPKWAPFFSGKSPRRWTEGTGLSRLLLRPRPGALCSGCGATGRRACSRALAVLLHQGLPQGTAGCLGARPCGPPVTAALSGPSCCSQGLRKHRPFLSYLLRPEGLQCCPPALLWARRWPATARWTCQAARVPAAAPPAAPLPHRPLPGSWAREGSGDASIGRGRHFVNAAFSAKPPAPVRTPVSCCLLNKM